MIHWGRFIGPAMGRSSFIAPFGPRLAAIGAVPPLNVDLVRLALLVFAADRSTIRRVGGTSWSSRDFSLTVPVSNAGSWEAAADELQNLLAFLTGDTWALDFKNARPLKERGAKRVTAAIPSRVVLMSGGADSALGVLESRRQLNPKESHVLVSHVGLTALSPIQRKVAKTASMIAPGPEQTVDQIRLLRRQHQVDGSKFKNENSTRSRSFLFLALGLAHGVYPWSASLDSRERVRIAQSAVGREPEGEPLGRGRPTQPFWRGCRGLSGKSGATRRLSIRSSGRQKGRCSAKPQTNSAKTR